MITLVCQKDYRIYGCRPHYHPEGVFLTKTCATCSVGGLCKYCKKTLAELDSTPDTIEEGFCPECLKQGGGL